MNPQKIIVCGASGLIGKEIARHFVNLGFSVMSITRADLQLTPSQLAAKITGAKAVINLAGASIAKRWTTRYKAELYQSRVHSTRQIAKAIEEAEQPPEVFFSASATGIYDPFEVHDEYSTSYAPNFLAKICLDWEHEATRICKENISRVIIGRLGMVLSGDGGALAAMKLPFSLGLGGRIGHGYQCMPFIHIHDVVSAIHFLIANPKAQGIYNLVAPQLISNREFTAALAKAFNRPARIPLSPGLLRIVLGERTILLTEGQKVIPHRLSEEGFHFKYVDLNSCLIQLYAHKS